MGEKPENEVGVADSSQFPELATLTPGQKVEVWVPWTPIVSLNEMGEDYSFSTTVSVKVDVAAGEKIVNNQHASENFGNVLWIGDIQKPLYTLPPMRFKNWGDPIERWKDPRIKDPRIFWVGLRPDAAGDFRIGLTGTKSRLIIARLKSAIIPFELKFTSIKPRAGTELDSLSARPIWRPGESRFLTLQVSTPIKTVNKAVPLGHPYRVRYDSKVLDGHTYAVHRVLASELSLRALLVPRLGSISVTGNVTPGQTGVYITLDYVNTTAPVGRPRPGDRVSRQVLVTDGAFKNSFTPKYPGKWSVRAFWQGSALYSSAVSRTVELTVP
jgi:hypothetical protein